MKKFIIIAICAICLSAAGALLYAGAYDSNLQLLSTSATETPMGKCEGDKPATCTAQCQSCGALYFAERSGKSTSFSGTCLACGNSVEGTTIDTGDAERP